MTGTETAAEIADISVSSRIVAEHPETGTAEHFDHCCICSQIAQVLPLSGTGQTPICGVPERLGRRSGRLAQNSLQLVVRKSRHNS